VSSSLPLSPVSWLLVLLASSSLLLLLLELELELLLVLLLLSPGSAAGLCTGAAGWNSAGRLCCVFRRLAGR
jgi:hypothetical protein